MTKYARKVIQIKATDSPNVQRGLKQQSQGITPDNEEQIPGVLSWQEYQQRRATWDAVRQCVGLDAQFWEGSDVLMFPPPWLEQAERNARELQAQGIPRKALAMGVDPGEGSANTAFVVVDRLGVIELVSCPTLDTTRITAECCALIRKHDLPPARVAFDRGGGGKQHADRLRQQGYPVQTVAFGESLAPPPRPQLSRPGFPERVEDREARYAYRNRRAQMYGLLRQLLDPAEGEVAGVLASIMGGAFAIPPWYPQFRQQLAPIPLTYDPEGRLELLPKNRRPDQKTDGNRRTLVELIGHSPDEADALALGVFAMMRMAGKVKAGAVPTR